MDIKDANLNDVCEYLGAIVDAINKLTHTVNKLTEKKD